MAISEEERRKLVEITRKKGLSEDQVVEEAIRDYIEKHGKAR